MKVIYIMLYWIRMIFLVQTNYVCGKMLTIRYENQIIAIIGWFSVALILLTAVKVCKLQDQTYLYVIPSVIYIAYI